MQTLNQKAPVSTKEYLHQSLVAVRQQEEAKKKKKWNVKLPQNKLRIMYANNEKVNIQYFKWIGLNRQNKDEGVIEFLINKFVIKSCTIAQNLNKTIHEFMSIKLNLTNNESMMVCLYYGKEESRSTKKQSENKFNQISTYTKNCIDNNSYVLILGDFNAKIGNDQEGIENGDRIISKNGFLLRDMIKMQHLQLVNSVPCCMANGPR